MKVSYKPLLYLPIIFSFLPAFVMYVPFLHATYLIFFLVLYFVLIFLIIKDRIKIYQKIYTITKQTPFKYFIIMLFLMCFNTLFLALTGHSYILQAIRSIIMQEILFICPILIYFIYIIDN